MPQLEITNCDIKLRGAQNSKYLRFRIGILYQSDWWSQNATSNYFLPNI